MIIKDIKYFKKKIIIAWKSKFEKWIKGKLLNKVYIRKMDFKRIRVWAAQ